MADPTVSAAFAQALTKFAVSKGVDEMALLARAEIDPDVFADPDNRVPFGNYETLMRAAKEMTGEPALALHFGARTNMAEVSIMGLVGYTCETLADSFVQFSRYVRLVVDVDEGTEIRFQMRFERGALWGIDTRRNPNAFPELTESAFAQLISAPRQFGVTQLALEVHVTHPAPSYAAEYERILNAPVTFNSHWNAMRIDERWMSHRIAQLPRYAFGVLSERAETLLRDLESAKTARGRVEGLLMPVLHTGDVSMDMVAGKLGISRQTLFRKLKAEGVTFEKVLDELRQRLALHYLSGKKVSVNEVAYLVGFSDPAAFSRAFKRWTGRSPREARAALNAC